MESCILAPDAATIARWAPKFFWIGVFMSAKTDAEAMFKKYKPAPESRLDEEARRIENMTRLRNLRLAREKADRDKDQADWDTALPRLSRLGVGRSRWRRSERLLQADRLG